MERHKEMRSKHRKVWPYIVVAAVYVLIITTYWDWNVEAETYEITITKDECMLCGEMNELLAYKANAQDEIPIGFFNVNTLSISELEYGGISFTGNVRGKGGTIINAQYNSNRMIYQARMTLRRGSRPDGQSMAEELCSNCIDYVNESSAIDYMIIRYEDRELFPLVSPDHIYTLFYVDDYAINVNRTKDKDKYEVYIFYAPER